jgi:hypothetical protein
MLDRRALVHAGTAADEVADELKIAEILMFCLQKSQVRDGRDGDHRLEEIRVDNRGLTGKQTA